MKINKLGLLIFGVCFVGLGIHDLVIGATYGFSAGNMSSMSITFEGGPIEFTLNIALEFLLGGMGVIKSFSNKDIDE